MSRHSTDAVVIGAGVIGSSIALELARNGREVIVLDRAGGIGHGSTGASSGIVRFHYSSHAGVALAWESVHAWSDWAGHLGHLDPAGLASFVRTGILVLDPARGAPDAISTLFDLVGVPWEFWDSETISRRLPHLDVGRFGPPAPIDSEAFFADPHGRVSGTFTPDAGHVGDPQLAAHNLAAAAERLGARFLLRREVLSVEARGVRRWQLTTTDGETFAADVVVNAGGPWSSALNRLAGLDGDFAVSARPLRQEVHEVSAPSGFDGPDGRAGVSIADLDLGIYVRSTGTGRVLIGGMEPECDPLEWLADPDTASPHATPSVFEAQVMRAARRFPGLVVPNRPSGLAGVYDATGDWTPIYDRTRADGFYVAMGTSGNQFKNAPVVGLLMSHLVDRIEAGQDHDRDPVRLTLPRTGSVVDLSAYSRLRTIDAGAPATVMG
ncbi:NAD(P)/FAD-dependent oxidoreductase [Nocardioides sp.]|uniref:NAD(P)/FAD-dependent oxidoreductase n=1 Tax=Nocardioides sp. TaxID=35761 RepID=UPI003D13C949